ncbi:hypothetical protein D3C72_1761800 [compost metagenome]
MFSNISVTTKTNKFNPNSFILLCIAFSSFSCLTNKSSILTVFTWAIIYFTSFFSLFLASKFINSSSEKLAKSVPAFSISMPYSSIFIFAILDNSSTAFLSNSVQVGDLSNNVSEIIALNIKPAIFSSISILFILYSLYKTVFVHPTGSE